MYEPGTLILQRVGIQLGSSLVWGPQDKRGYAAISLIPILGGPQDCKGYVAMSIALCLRTPRWQG